MNPQRYIMPAIIAAGLHSSLVYFFSDHYPAPLPPPKDPPVILPEVPRIEMMPEETTSSAAGDSGGVSDLPPSIPDIPQQLPPENIFRIEVAERVESIKPISDLPKIPERFGPPGDGEGLRNGPPGIFSDAALDRVPRATVQPAPAYPHTMRSTGTSGSVTVEFVVDTTGRVIAADAVRWTHREFADPAVRAVLRWRFEPGTVSGRKVRFRMAVPIEFNAER